MSKKILIAGLIALGTAAILIGASIFFFGADVTVRFFVGILNAIGVAQPAPTELSSPDVDSELRFYAVFWVTYGAFLIHSARDLANHLQRVPLLLGLFFVGGLGRALSYATTGPPHTLFVILMAIELAFPPFLYALYRLHKERSTHASG